MYHTVAMAVIALAAVALPAETSLAFGPGSGFGDAEYAAPSRCTQCVVPVAASRHCTMPPSLTT